VESLRVGIAGVIGVGGCPEAGLRRGALSDLLAQLLSRDGKLLGAELQAKADDAADEKKPGKRFTHWKIIGDFRT
jgi:hypothetical protein